VATRRELTRNLDVAAGKSSSVIKRTRRVTTKSSTLSRSGRVTHPASTSGPGHNFNRWDLLPASKAASRGLNAANVAGNRRDSDRYHHPQGLKSLLPGGGKGKGGAGKTLRRLARRSNNGNIPGHGFGGVGGISGVPLPHLSFKKHHGKMTHQAKPVSLGGGGGRVGLPTMKPKPPMKPLPARRIKMSPATKQKKPIQDVKLRLGSAPTIRPKFARNKYGP
jgi:hypothetical protein